MLPANLPPTNAATRSHIFTLSTHVQAYTHVIIHLFIYSTLFYTGWFMNVQVRQRVSTRKVESADRVQYSVYSVAFTFAQMTSVSSPINELNSIENQAPPSQKEHYEFQIHPEEEWTPHCYITQDTNATAMTAGYVMPLRL